MEIMRNTGDVALANIWYEQVAKDMAAMAAVANDSANAAFFTSEQNTVDAGIKAVLVDPTTGLLKTAAGQNSTNLDIRSSALWVHLGFPYAKAHQMAASPLVPYGIPSVDPIAFNITYGVTLLGSGRAKQDNVFEISVAADRSASGVGWNSIRCQNGCAGRERARKVSHDRIAV